MCDLAWLLLSLLGTFRSANAKSLGASSTCPYMLLTALATLATILSGRGATIHVLHVTSSFFVTTRTDPRSILLTVRAPDAEQTADSDTAYMLFELSTAALFAT